MSGKHIIIAGATGLVGSHLLQQCLDDPEIASVKAFTRHTLDISHPKLKCYSVDYHDLDPIEDAFENVDAILCCLGTTMKKAKTKDIFQMIEIFFPKHLALKGLEHNVASFHIVTAMAADPNSRIFYNQVKGEIERTLDRLSYEHLHIYQPSFILGKRPELRLSEIVAKLIMPPLFALLGKWGLPYKPIQASTIAANMRHYLHTPGNGTQIHTNKDMLQL